MAFKPWTTRKPPSRFEFLIDRSTEAMQSRKSPTIPGAYPTYRWPFMTGLHMWDDWEQAQTRTFKKEANAGGGRLISRDGDICCEVNGGATGGTTDFPYIAAGLHPSISSSHDWTVFVDVEITGTVGDYPCVWSIRDFAGTSVGQCWFGQNNASADMQFAVNGDSGFNSVNFTGGWPGVGRHRIMLTHKNLNGEFRLYTNGLLTGSVDDTSTWPANPGPPHSFNFGVLNKAATSTNRVEGYYHNAWVNIAHAVGPHEAALLTERRPYSIYVPENHVSEPFFSLLVGSSREGDAAVSVTASGTMTSLTPTLITGNANVFVTGVATADQPSTQVEIDGDAPVTVSALGNLTALTSGVLPTNYVSANLILMNPGIYTNAGRTRAVDSPAAIGPSIWMYSSAVDTQPAINQPRYFSDGKARGMKVGDMVMVSSTSIYTTTLHTVAHVDDSTGEASITPPTLSTPDDDTTAPTVPNITQAIGTGLRSVFIDWDDSFDADSGVAHYTVFRDGTPIDTVLVVQPTSYVDSGLVDGTSYTYTVSCTDNAGNESAQSIAKVATTNTPASISITSPTLGTPVVNSTYQFFWSASQGQPPLTWDISAGSVPDGMTFSTVVPPFPAGTPAVGVLDGTPTLDATYNFTVRVTDSFGTSATVAETVTVDPEEIVVPPDTTAPIITVAPTETFIANQSATIQWTTDEASNSVVEYGQTTAYGSSTSNILLVTDHSVTLTNLIAGTPYFYSVTSTDAAGNTSIASTGNFTTTNVTGPTSDYVARSTGNGVFNAENWATRDTNWLRTVEVQSGNAIPNMEIVDEHGLDAGGKCCRIWTRSNDPGIASGWNGTLNGVPTGQQHPPASYRRFYFQVVLWGDDIFNWPFKGTDIYGNNTEQAIKLLQLDRCPWYSLNPHQPSSNAGSLVLVNQANYGFITGYRYDSTLPAFSHSALRWQRSQFTPSNSGNFAWQPSVDSGGALTDENSYQQRYGPFRSGMDTGFDLETVSATRISDQIGTHPDPDAATTGIPWHQDDYTVVEVFMDFDADRVQVWAAKMGDAPTLISDSVDWLEGTARISNSATRLAETGDGNSFPIDGIDGYYLSNFRTNGVGVAARPDMYVDYAEIIASTEPIPFPGHLGTALPNNTETAPGSLAVSPNEPPDGIVGQEYPLFGWSATGGVSPYTTWWATGDIPPGLTFSNVAAQTGIPATSKLEGTPTTVTGSPFSFVVHVQDSAGTEATASYDIAITSVTLEVTETQPPNGIVGDPYSHQMAATNGTPPYSWAVSAGTIPTGLSLGSNGLISGTPSTVTGSPFSWTAEVTDSVAATDTWAITNHTISAASSVASIIAGMAPNSWYRFPSSSLDASGVRHSPSPSGYWPGIMGPGWSSGDYDFTRHRFMVSGGGHASYLGNEVYAFDVNAGTWSKLIAPTTKSAWEVTAPASVHTYGQVFFLESQDVYAQFGGAGDSISQPGNVYTPFSTWMLDLGTNAWSQGADLVGVVENDFPCGYDRVNDKVFMLGYNRTSTYDVATDTWSLNPVQATGVGARLNTTGEYALFSNGERWMYWTGGFSNGQTNFRRHPINSSHELGDDDWLSPSGTGPGSTQAPGFVWLDSYQRFFAWQHNTPSNVYSYNPFDGSDGRWTQYAGSGSAPSTPDPGQYRGTYNRFQWMPEYGAFVLVLSTSQDVYLYKPPASVP